MNPIVSGANKEMDKALSYFKSEIQKVRIGKATPQMLEGLKVDYYGTPTPIQQVGSINVVDSKTMTIQPWEKALLQPIEKAILASNLGITPQNDGDIIRINLPPLTEERRKEIYKQVQQEGEQCKIVIRNIRREKNEFLKKTSKEGISEDEAKSLEVDIQDITNQWIKKVDKKVQEKQEEIMTV